MRNGSDPTWAAAGRAAEGAGDSSGSRADLCQAEAGAIRAAAFLRP